MKFPTECKHRRHVTHVGLLLSGPSSKWEFTSARDLFASLNSEIPTSEHSGTRHNIGVIVDGSKTARRTLDLPTLYVVTLSIRYSGATLTHNLLSA